MSNRAIVFKALQLFLNSLISDTHKGMMWTSGRIIAYHLQERKTTGWGLGGHLVQKELAAGQSRYM